jgi:hypothetical protein
MSNDGTAIHLISGATFDYADPFAATITEHDVAHALARISRYTGHCAATWSVAQHTCLVRYLVENWYNEPGHAHGALHHDDAEAMTGDWPTPQKNWLRALGIDYDKACAPIELAICKQLGLVVDDLHAGVVKNADAAAYEIEVRSLKPLGYATYEELDEDLLMFGTGCLQALSELSVPEVEQLWRLLHARGAA